MYAKCGRNYIRNWLARRGGRREALGPRQQAEAIQIRQKSDAFAEAVEEYHRFFQQHAPFSVSAPELRLEHVSALSLRHLEPSLLCPVFCGGEDLVPAGLVVIFFSLCWLEVCEINESVSKEPRGFQMLSMSYEKVLKRV